VPAAALSNSRMLSAVDRNLSNVYRFIDELDRGGILEARRAHLAER